MLGRLRRFFRDRSKSSSSLEEELSFSEEVEREMDDLVDMYGELRISDSPTSITAQMKNNIGITHKALGRLDDAEKAFLDAIETSPECISAYRNLGALYLEQGRSEKAREMFETAKRRDETLPKYVLRPEKRAEFREEFRENAEERVRERRKKRRRK